MIPEVRARSTPAPYHPALLTNQTYRENAGALERGLRPLLGDHRSRGQAPVGRSSRLKPGGLERLSAVGESVQADHLVVTKREHRSKRDLGADFAGLPPSHLPDVHDQHSLARVEDALDYDPAYGMFLAQIVLEEAAGCLKAATCSAGDLKLEIRVGERQQRLDVVVVVDVEIVLD
jgi:hypothetical protein